LRRAQFAARAIRPMKNRFPGGTLSFWPFSEGARRWHPSSCLWMTLHFDPQISRAVRCASRTLRVLDHLNCVHRLRIHPVNAPGAGMNRHISAGSFDNAAIAAMISNMWSPASGIPTQKEARPTVMMHRYCLARRRHGNFEYPHQAVFENYFVGSRGSLDRVVAVRKFRIVLAVKVKGACEKNKKYARGNGKSSFVGEKKVFAGFHVASPKTIQVQLS